jgi:hypothetical protein
MHGVVDQVLDDFAGDHQIEVFVGIGIRIAFRVEKIDAALKIAIRRAHSLTRDCPQRAVVCPAHFTIPAETRKQWRDLHIAAQFQNVACGLRRRDQSESPCQTRDVFGEILARAVTLCRKVSQGKARSLDSSMGQ